MTKAGASVRISQSLRHRIEEAREKSGRSLTGEVEARLRWALRQTGGDGLILLHLDSGLMAHLEALTQVHFVGDLETVTIFLIRSQMIEYMSKECWRSQMAPRLPSPYREANAEAGRVYASLTKR